MPWESNTTYVFLKTQLKAFFIGYCLVRMKLISKYNWLAEYLQNYLELFLCWMQLCAWSLFAFVCFPSLVLTISWKIFLRILGYEPRLLLLGADIFIQVAYPRITKQMWWVLLRDLKLLFLKRNPSSNSLWMFQGLHKQKPFLDLLNCLQRNKTNGFY